MMNHYGHGPYGFGSSEPDEMEALQSDVMRFMAILGLCLMIIFALVQSLPQISTSKKAIVEEKVDATNTDSTLLQEETVTLKKERDAMYNELDELQRKLTQLDNEVLQKETIGDQLREDEKQLQQKIAVEKQKLKMLELKFAIREQSLQPSPESTSEKKIVPLVPKTVTIPKKTKTDVPKQEVVVAEQKSTSEQKEGFTLRFQSPSALDYLVRRAEVQLLVQVDTQFHALQANGTKLAFHSATSPASFHEMEAHTVPIRYKRLLAGSGIRVSQGQQRTWGVVLPPSIRAQINQTMAGYKGGELRIDRHGEVSYHTSGML